ncbi:MAG: exodeoxyribonuclease V subunit alpha [Deltaproteobacteria bacterium]|nr:exodeoxyribonuclease V subunit alpha [Deltaproteobacteria bacterium]
MDARSPALSGTFGEIDLAFADFVRRMDGRDLPEVWLAAALASRAVRQGHSCLDLALASREGIPDPGGPCPAPPSPADWARVLEKSPMVGAPGDERPLVLTGGRLYLHRYLEAEENAAKALSRLLVPAHPQPDPKSLSRNLRLLFPESQAGPDWQAAAAATAALRRLTVVSGGPGTGKTYTVARILALWALDEHGPRTVALAAPTGKAAARLAESLLAAKGSLPLPAAVTDALPAQAATLHRLLEGRPGKGFGRNRANPLAVDAVVVDEASMVDLDLLAALLGALPGNARLVLLGDKDQLSSVAPGAIMGDLCPPGRGNAFSPEFASLLSAATGADFTPFAQKNAPAMADSVVILEKSRRFGGALADLARAVRSGDAREAEDILQAGEDGVSFIPLSTPRDLAAALAPLVEEGFAPYLQEEGPKEAAETFSAFRVLCAVRRGPYGTEEANRLAERVLTRKGLLDARKPWYEKRPVMIAENDHDLKLYNGDTGIFADGKVWFGERTFSPLVLPAHETVFAMTVHKSQGSEFSRAAVVLPEDSPAASRQLLYTAVTRARDGLVVAATRKALTDAVENPVRRTSGLAEALWGRNPAGR